MCRGGTALLKICAKEKFRNLNLTPFLNTGAGLYQETLEEILLLISMDYGEPGTKLCETCKEMLESVSFLPRMDAFTTLKI